MHKGNIVTKRFSVDPLPDVAPALLNSADIQAYQAICELVRGEPFDADRLKAASYKILCKGTIFWTDDNNRRKSTKISGDEIFTLKRNSIAFVSPDAEFHLPDFMAARFNLSIGLVHQGLLLGTGPLIDPGFKGRLSIPIHNLTTREVELKASSGLIWVEFTKLSPGYQRQHGSKQFNFVESFKSGELGGAIERYFDKTGGVPTQSTLHQNAEIWEREVSRVEKFYALARRWSIFGGLAGLVTLVALLASILASYLASVSVAQQAQSTIEQARQSLAQADKAAVAASEAIGEISARLDKLEKNKSVLPKTAASGVGVAKR